MTLRRYAPLKPSRGTQIPPKVRANVRDRDRGCIGRRLFMGDCQGGLEMDHVRTGGTSLKSVSCECNLVWLCSGHHRFKTEHGKAARPSLLAYLATFGYTPHENGHLDDCGHIDPRWDCDTCQSRKVLA